VPKQFLAGDNILWTWYDTIR